MVYPNTRYSRRFNGYTRGMQAHFNTKREDGRDKQLGAEMPKGAWSHYHTVNYVCRCFFFRHFALQVFLVFLLLSIGVPQTSHRGKGVPATFRAN